MSAADELESIADYAAWFCSYMKRLDKHELDFSEDSWKDLIIQVRKTQQCPVCYLQSNTLIAQPCLVGAHGERKTHIPPHHLD